MSNNLILRTQASPYGDETKGSVLSQAELDNNFIFLKGLDINNVNLDGTTLKLNRINGETISVNLNDFRGPAGPAGPAGSAGQSGERGPAGQEGQAGVGAVTGATYSSVTGILTLDNTNGSSIIVNGFITGGTADSTLGTLTLNNSDGTSININGFSTGTTPTYTNSTPTTARLGGIAQGTTFTSQTIQQMFDALLYPYQIPTFTSFSRSDLETNYDLGESITIGLKTFSWGTSNPTNIQTNSINIFELFTNTFISTNISNTGSLSMPLTNTTGSTSSRTLSLYRIFGTNTNSEQMTPLTITANWRNRWYYGKSVNESIVASDVTGLTNALATTVINTTVQIPATNDEQYMYIALPTTFTQFSNLKESTAGCFGSDIPYLLQGTVAFGNVYGVSTTYNVYRSTFKFIGLQNVWFCAP
jgi:hypothetical protein